MTFTLLNTVETYTRLQSFETISELNEAVKEHRQKFCDELTKSALAILDILARYACKYIGVCYLSKAKIAEMLEVNIRTVRRACNTLETLGIIKQYALKRHNGDCRQSSNAIVIQASKGNVLPQCPPKETLAKTSHIKNTYDTGKRETEHQADVVISLKEGLVTKLPGAIKAIAPFFQMDELYRITGTIYKAKAAVDRNVSLEAHEELYRNTLLSIVHALKLGKIQHLHGAIYTAVKRVTRSIEMKALATVVWCN
ncbi:helix-turn-helix domain-containing protein [Viridibacillus sp. YIM B01967]|uniref:Helix-turn-helix domain-containing protein n=1 Tax=Viridibacillus soli TaxID=2798301 RepID=A0ABS1HBI8_9BACL|nr:helix-turn-helix domain-containing protein [Viridibacillus soli]MBK3496452.1 helix-turn-helix domain-containing protein [Viridibacillus soli]